VAHRQLIALGYTRHEIQRRIKEGRLHIVHRGVYAVGHRKLTRRGRWMAAVLACGPGAVLSHRDAAALHNLRGSGSAKAIHVTASGKKRPRPGIHVHNVRHLHPTDRTIVDGIPVTSVHRTLLDYAETERPQELRWAFEKYDRLDLLDMRKLDAVMARNPGRRGIKPLTALITEYRGPAPDTRSGKERRFLALVREAGLPEPSVNVSVARIVVDFYWPQYKLVLEVDSYTYHHTPADRAEDRRKERVLRANGCEVRRVTDVELDETPEIAVADVKVALSAAAGAAGR
jgi:very-short-patch-repair endonuclease